MHELVPEPKENSSKEEKENEDAGETPLTIMDKFEDDHRSMFIEDSKRELIPWINNLTNTDVTTTQHEIEQEQVTKDQPDIKDYEQKETLNEIENGESNMSQKLKMMHSDKREEKSATPNAKVEWASSLADLTEYEDKPLGRNQDGARGQSEADGNENVIRRNYTFMCDKCTYETSHKGHFLKHFKMHNDQMIRGGYGKRLICDQCPYETSHKGRFLKHCEVHNDLRNFVCHKCPYRAKCKYTLKDHIKGVHDNIKDLVCEECGYATSRRSQLSEHLQTVHNTGEKQFQCDKCPYKAHLKKILVKHVKNLHLGREYKFKCEQCKFKSNREANLTTHILQVHN